MTRVIGTGLSALDEPGDLSAHLDELAALGCETVELPLYAMDVIVGGRIRDPALRTLAAACAGRPFRYTVHGPLAINFFDEAFRLPRHFDVLRAAMEASAALGAKAFGNKETELPRLIRLGLDSTINVTSKIDNARPDPSMEIRSLTI